MVKSKLKIAVFIESVDKYKNILELVNRLDKHLIEVDVYSLKVFNSKYSFNLYFRRRKLLFHNIYKEYDVVIALGEDKDVIKYAISTKCDLRILFTYEEKHKKYSKFDKIIREYEKYTYVDEVLFKKNLPTVKVFNDNIIISCMNKEKLLDYTKDISYVFELKKFENKDLFSYLETNYYIYLKEGVEDLDNMLKCYLLGSTIFEEEYSDIIGIKTKKLNSLKSFKTKAKKNNSLATYNKKIINNFLELINYKNYH
jgi:hypothetical protein